MPKDPLHAISEAEMKVSQRFGERERTDHTYRATLAAELIADELTMLVAEVRTLRYLYATAQAKPGG